MAVENKAYVGTRLAYMGHVYGVVLPEERLSAYIDHLSHLSPAQIDGAVKRLIQTWKPSGPNPYPAICEILAACGASPDSNAQLAITTLRKVAGDVGSYASVSFGDPALHYVVKAYGGWIAICNWPFKTWDINEGRLREAYREAKLAGCDGGMWLSGHFEIGNGIGDVTFTLYVVDVYGNKVMSPKRHHGSLNDADYTALAKLCYSPDVARDVIENYKHAKMMAVERRGGNPSSMSDILAPMLDSGGVIELPGTSFRGTR